MLRFQTAENKMTKTIKRVFVTLLLILTLTVVVSAEPVHWYVKNNTEHKRPQLDSALSVINGHNACYLGKDEKVIYLTFDAGYENGNVEKILDILKKHNATGAFFILENLITRNTELVRRMANEGHLVCNHTARHKNMSLINDKAAFERELKALETVYTEYTGKELDKFYRPPEGSFNKQNLEFADEMGYKTVFWSFAYADWDNSKQPEYEKAIKKVMSHIHNGEIMLLHPTSATNAAILDELLTRLEADGYRFGSLNEISQDN